ncbi:hypothetical protein [Thioclava sp. SK-1]|uniref:hypothetical protein n=1 Tax=Thioclava sp. SK-1 TaxID=1889770 RepID=UPI000A9D5545|nr:hypothetical protein [Thioclava sp. SK-1]
MDVVIREGSRGLSMMIDLTLDRLLVPAALVVSLIGATLIAYNLSEMIDPTQFLPHQL